MPFFFLLGAPWMLCGTFLDVFSEPAELSGGHLCPILGVSLSGGNFFLLCATCRIQTFFFGCWSQSSCLLYLSGAKS